MVYELFMEIDDLDSNSTALKKNPFWLKAK